MIGALPASASTTLERIAAIRARIDAGSYATADMAARTGADTTAREVRRSSGVAGATPGAPGDTVSVRAAGSTTGTLPAAHDAAVDRLTERLPAAGRPWAAAISDAASRNGVDPALLASLVQHESGFDPDVRSSAGAIGMAQLMPGTADGLGVDPTDPLQNLDGGARYLREQIDRFGDVELALAAYNAGPTRVAAAGGVPRITETQNYVTRVMGTWQELR